MTKSPFDILAEIPIELLDETTLNKLFDDALETIDNNELIRKEFRRKNADPLIWDGVFAEETVQMAAVLARISERRLALAKAQGKD